jgi:uncharacterized protein
MIERNIEKAIVRSMNHFPVVVILGSRQVGKTTLAKKLKETIGKPSEYIDLELPSDLNKLQDPELYLERFTDSLVIIDEIQRMPELFPLLRALIDRDRKPGRFLILGSASLDLIKQASESLAGRIVYHELSPFNLNEISDGDGFRDLWLRGGYPESFLAESGDLSFAWRDAFIRTYLERDIPQLGIQIPSTQLRKFWTMIAHSHGQLWNASQLAKSMGVSAPTVNRYLEILNETFIIRLLQPYFANVKKRLVKSPKIYIRDTGLLHSLLMHQTFGQLQGHPVVGHSWEGFVIEQIIRILPEHWQVFFYRTSAGAEIDLVIIEPGSDPIAVEIKHASSPKVEKGFWHAYEDLNCKKGFVVYPGKDIYPIRRDVSVLPIMELDRLF